jgi:hypothetical protein|tara:strand:+ start:207 stop:590 length:384 start_codon:yes stop_codon:yes gene_type:complete
MSIVASLVGPVTGLLDKFIEDKDQKARLSHEIATLAEKQSHEALKGQLEINKMEAAHKSLFVAGWRPAIGWICALGLLYNTIIVNLLGIWLEVDPVDTTLLVPVMMGLLGLGAMRSYEKVNQVAREK